MVRDFIYIGDAIRGIICTANDICQHHIFNLGSGYRTGIKDLISIIESMLKLKMNVVYKEGIKEIAEFIEKEIF